MKPLYLDWAATAMPDTQALTLAFEASTLYFANIASKHEAGKCASTLYENARRTIAAFLTVKPEELIATSGATEANALVLLSLLQKQKRSGTVLTSSIEHDSIFKQVQVLEKFGYTVRNVPVNRRGIIEPETVASLLSDDTVLLAVMAANNETGALQPIQDIASILAQHKRPIHFHVDAVQAFGKLPLTLEGVHSMSFSAHKIGGPKGFGLLYLHQKKQLTSLFQGGNQERAIRSGTQNLFGMLGCSYALQNKNMQEDFLYVSQLANKLLDGLASIPGIVVIPEDRTKNDPSFSPYIMSCAIPGLTGEVIVRFCSDNDIMIATGSACSSAHTDRRVLSAMHVEKTIASGAVRISMGTATQAEDIDALLNTLNDCIKKYKP